MAIVEMSKISLIGLNKDKEQILDYLMHMGVMEIIDSSEELSSGGWIELMTRDGDMEAVSDLEARIEGVGSALGHLSAYKTVKKALFETKRIISRGDLDKVIKDEEQLWATTGKITGLVEQMSGMKTERNRNANLIGALEPWNRLDIPLDLSSTRYATISLGVVPPAVDTEKLKQELAEQAPESHVNIINQDPDQIYILLIYHSRLDEDVARVLKKYGFSKVSFKDMKGTVQENISRLQQNISEIDKNYKEMEFAIASYASEIDNLEVLYDYFIMKRDSKKALGSILKTDSSFYLEGWIPRDLGEKVRHSIMNKWDSIVSIREAGENEEFPILLSNKSLGHSVESITQMYSLPSHREIDPNAVMAPFFILFFGLMLGDGGYGILMVLIAGFVLSRYQLNEGDRKFMKLMFYCGFSTIFWGALFGSWFGIDALTRYAVWFNPVEDPQEMLKWALVFGIIHIYVGIGVRGINLIRHRKYLDAVLDVVPWYVFFTGFVMFALPYAPKVDADSVTGLVDAGRYLIIAGAAFVILTQGRGNKNIFMKLIGGVSKLYDLVAFMSDVLSYSRLLALGLATSVIASIVNQMAAISGLDNIFKIIGFVLVLAIGHVFNFAINALGAYVHSSRLQYIEFFGKFYEGGGTAFQPLRAETKYIKFKN